MSFLLTTVRGWVSKRKRRYNKDGYDLDLAYITDNIIAMGAPSQGTTGLYRNPMAKVQKFLCERHGTGGYCVYNLCSEEAYAYKPQKFENVANFPFDDHQVPPLSLIKAFCEHVQSFLADHPNGVAAVHCKAGKGRTGIMITCYLLFSGRFHEPQQALEFYANRRTYDGKGITNASQERSALLHHLPLHAVGGCIALVIQHCPDALKTWTGKRLTQMRARYVQYFARALRVWPERRVVVLQAVRMSGLNWMSGKIKGVLVLRCRPTGAAAMRKIAVVHLSQGDTLLAEPWQLEGDIKLEVSRFGMRKKNSVLFSAWLHSAYLEPGELVLTRHQLDKVAKLVPSHVQLHLTFKAFK